MNHDMIVTLEDGREISITVEAGSLPLAIVAAKLEAITRGHQPVHAKPKPTEGGDT